MAGDSPETHSERFITETGILSWLDISIETEEEGHVVLKLPHRDEVTNPHGDTVHGGIVATLIDNAGGTALRTVLTSPETSQYATTELNVSYIRPATDDLRADATVRRNGKSIAVIQVDVDSRLPSGEWATVAIGRVSYYVDMDIDGSSEKDSS